MAEQTKTLQESESPTKVGHEEVADQFVGQWNRLVSTTNWEKGRIICQWRESLMDSKAAVTEYSDEAWAQLVGGVTSQHVGRLRRVYQRFGEVYTQYEGLYWSHFQAALDWDDAEMWLEGAIQNKWSVSQMRGKRWETLGTPPAEQLAEVQATEQAELESNDAPTAPSQEQSPAANPTVAPKNTSIKPVDAATEVAEDSPPQVESEVMQAEPKSPPKKRLKVNVEALPDDLADAFEQFKLAIIAQRREGWHETTPDSVLECLEALRELVLAEEG